jgi:N-acetylglucosaminyldiphosphoundecaprenol N-acetyl-beta-D-mannosaminyltransferase
MTGGVSMTWSDGVSVTVPSRAALLADLEARLAESRGFTVATLNLDHVVKLRRDPAFRTAYAAHSHVTADGNPIVWLSRLAGQRLELIPGSELVQPVAGIAARLEVPVALFGSTATALDGAAQTLKRQFPGLDVVARLSPPQGFDPHGAAADAAIAALAASGARLVLLALGAPKQEVFAARAAARMPAAGFLSIGAGLDFLAGHQVRAPAWVRAVAAEWLWRLASNPRRLAGRYAACVAVLPGMTRAALRTRRAGQTLRSGGR